MSKYLSHSQVKLFQRCPGAWNLRYKVHADTEPKGVAAAFGIAVHNIIAETYQRLKKEKYDGVLRPEMFAPDGLDRALALKHITGAEKVGDAAGMLHNLCEFANWKFDWRAVLGVEHKFVIKLDGCDKAFLGYIDLLDGDRKGVVRVIDYKTGRVPEARISHDEHADDMQCLNDLLYWCLDDLPEGHDGLDQVGLYAMVAALKYPKADVIEMGLLYLRDGSFWATAKTPTEILKEEARFAAAGVAVLSATAFPYNVTRLCTYCDVRGACPEYLKEPEPLGDIDG